MPKRAQLVLLVLALALFVFVPTRSWWDPNAVRYELVFDRHGKLDPTTMVLEFGGLGIIAGFVFVATRKT